MFHVILLMPLLDNINFGIEDNTTVSRSCRRNCYCRPVVISIVFKDRPSLTLTAL